MTLSPELGGDRDALVFGGIVVSWTVLDGELLAFDDLGDPYPVTDELRAAILEDKARRQRKHSGEDVYDTENAYEREHPVYR